MKRALIPLVLSVAVGLLACLAVGVAANAEVMKWTVDKVKREAIVIGPSKTNDSGKAPVIFVFHGHGGDMKEISGLHFEKSWTEAVVVYMQGLPTNPVVDPQGYGWIYDHDPGGDRDVKFVDAVLATLREKFPVDDRRIYATGFSNGGMFTYVLWGARANIFAAFAAVAGRIVPAVHLTEPKPILVVAGREDMQVPFKNQLNAMQTARDLDGSAAQGDPCGAGCTFYASSRGAPIVTYIHPGGHVYPSLAVDMTVLFFKDYALPK